MNITPYHSSDAVLTEALVHESQNRAANLKSVTARNVLFGTAALGLGAKIPFEWYGHRDCNVAEYPHAVQVS